MGRGGEMIFTLQSSSKMNLMEHYPTRISLGENGRYGHMTGDMLGTKPLPVCVMPSLSIFPAT